jgi:outer membrane murein-binding lipoprotein Lpp
MITMNRLTLGASLLATTLLVTGTPASAADGSSALAKDLTATISLLGLPCGQVVNVTTQGKNDHLATCSNGSRYRVYVNAQGRVTAEKR